MIETILLGSFFFGSEPEQLLFMLYTILLIWSAAMRSVPSQPIFAPHLLDVAAAAVATPSETSSTAYCEAEACVPLTKSLLVTNKFCGRTIGEVAATCGFSLAASVYMDPRRFLWVDEGTKRILRKKFRRFVSYALGVTVNFIADMENWWAQHNSKHGKQTTDSSGGTTPAVDL